MNKQILKDKSNRLNILIYNNFTENSSGDLFDIFELPNKNSLLFIGDVCGKGKPAFPLKEGILNIIKQQISSYTSISSFMQILNTEIKKQIKDERYISAFAAEIDFNSKKLTYCNAGHPEQILVKKNGATKIFMLDTEGYLLGMFDQGNYEEKEIAYSKKDLFIIYTDGFEENFYAQHNIELDAKLKEILKETKDEEAILNKLCSDLDVFKSEKPDDDSILGILKFLDTPPESVTPKILVSKKSPVELEILTSFMKAKNFEFDVCKTTELMAALKKTSYLILITDFHPNQFLAELHSQFKETYIIVINSEKSVADALNALKLGVYRYLETPFNQNDLFQYIKKVFERKIPTMDMVVEKGSEDWLEINAPASFEFSERLDKYLSNLIKVTNLPQDEIDDISYAFLEMTNNAIEWGCKQDLTKSFQITYTVFSDRIIFKIEDEGAGFDFKQFFDVEEITLSENEENREKVGKRPGGLGIHLVKQFMDELKFNEKGNIVLMTKYIDPQPSTLEN